MYRPGHYGVALLVYAPVGLAAILVGAADLAVLGGGLLLALTTLPDIDHRLPLVSHRGVTHTLAFAFLVGGAVGAGGWLFAPAVALQPRTAGAFGALVGTLAILAHLLADVLTPSGIRPLWPLSKRRYSLSLARADNSIANYGLLLSGLLAVGLVLAVSEAGLAH